MTLHEAEKYLLGLELFGMRFGLERMHALTAALGLPQNRFASIHVVGSNGKSSTTRFVAAILERSGLRTGTYTSPHLRSFAERVEVGERPVGGERFGEAVEHAREAALAVERTLEDDERVTQFEALTAAAFHELARARVDAAVIEAGLGGRHDATNVIPSKVAVLTSVSLEHTRWLGSTLGEIAGEKLAVVRDHSTLVTPPDLPAEVEEQVLATVAERHARRVTAPALEPPPRLRAAGAFQPGNFALAVAAAQAFLDDAPDRAAVADAAASTVIPGRLEAVAQDPLTLLDGAHNPAGAAALSASLDEVLGDRRPRVLVMGVLEDKAAGEMLDALLPPFDRVVLTRPGNPRAVDPAELAAAVAQRGAEAEVVADPAAALARGRELAGHGGAVVVAGSIYLVADLARGPGAGAGSTL